MTGTEALIGAIMFFIAFWAFAATMHLLDAKANCIQFQDEIYRLRKSRDRWESLAESYEEELGYDSTIHGEKPNA